MNELFKNIDVYKTPFPIEYPEFKNFTSDASLIHDKYGSLDEYIFAIRWFARFACPEESINEVKEIIQKQLMNDLYGEVRDSIYELKKHIYSCNIDAAIKILNDLEKIIT